MLACLALFLITQAETHSALCIVHKLIGCIRPVQCTTECYKAA